MKTSEKGDVGSVLAMADLTKKGYSILVPLSEMLPFDFIAYKDGQCFRIQAKYSAKGFLSKDRDGGNGLHPYRDNDFDYYALYIPSINKIVYPSIKFKGSKISTSVPNCSTPYYWYEDFLEFTDAASKRVNTQIQSNRRPYKPKVVQPSKEELENLVWKIPTT